MAKNQDTFLIQTLEKVRDLIGDEDSVTSLSKSGLLRDEIVGAMDYAINQARFLESAYYLPVKKG